MLLIILHYFLFILVTLLWFYSILILIAVISVYMPTFRSVGMLDRLVEMFMPQFKWLERKLPETSQKWAPVIYWVGWFAIVKLLEWGARMIPFSPSF